MKRILKYLLLGIILVFSAETAVVEAQSKQEVHKVKKKETIFGIARQYGLSVQELVDANPEMNTPGYELKKDSYIVIPRLNKQDAKETKPQPVEQPVNVNRQTQPNAAKTGGTIRLGVMLPLHDINGDGRRMVEYYRGVLMACDSLKKLGISVDVHAWNTPDDKDIAPILQEKAAQQCDIIIGPLYSKQMAQLSEFVTRHDIQLVIPFSINAPELLTNRNIFQIYQSQNNFNESVIEQFMQQFKDYHPVFVDCNDSTSTKGLFTSGLRRQLEVRGINYGITNLKSPETAFANAFSKTQRNVVVLNTGRSPELNVAISKINGVAVTQPETRITLFGYTEWLMYTQYQLNNFYKYDVYIPTTFHYNPLTSKTQRVQQKYRWNFHQDMMDALPRFAITGFDHAMFFLQGFHRYGKNFTGAPGLLGYEPVQTPLKFERIGNGGLRNRSLLFVHYLPEQRVETITF